MSADTDKSPVGRDVRAIGTIISMVLKLLAVFWGTENVQESHGGAHKKTTPVYRRSR